MDIRSIAFLAGVLLLGAPGLQADNKPEFLAAFDLQGDAIQFEFENQAETGCIWRPYPTRDAMLEMLQEAGLQTRPSSLWVLEVVTWGAAVDDYHCAVLLEMELRRFSVTVELPDGNTIRMDIPVWEASEMLTGPKIHMDDRVREKALAYLEQLLEGMPK